MRQIVYRLRQRRPDLRIVMMTPLHRADEYAHPSFSIPLRSYVDAIIQFGKINHIPVYDQYRQVPINKETFGQYLVDGVHPNACGGRVIAKGMTEFLQAIFGAARSRR